jgi:signal transduction histidine kinase
MYKEYFTNLLGTSDELNWYELDFVDEEFEELYRISNQSEEDRNSKYFSFVVIIHYILSIGVNILLNGMKLVRTGYILIGGIVIEMILLIISYKIRTNYYLFSRLKIVRFLIIYFNYMTILCFPVIGFAPDIFLRTLYVQILFINMYFIYFMHFNYMLLAFIPIFNCLSILWVQYNAFTKFPYYLFPELFANFIFQYCIFLIKKNEVTSKKKMFLRSQRNKYHIEYITKLVDVLNSMIICIKNDEILYLNQYGKDLLENFQDVVKGKKNTGNFSIVEFKEYEYLIADGKTKNEFYNKILEQFFNSLSIEKSHQSDYVNENKNHNVLSHIIREKIDSEKGLSNVFEEIGLFNYNQFKSEQHFEVYIRKVKTNDEVFELLFYDISSIKIAEKTKAESKYKQKILAKIAHEFKTPLITIITLIQSLNDHQLMSILETSVKKKLSHVVNLSNYTIYLIQDIIQYVSESSTIKFILSKVNLKEILLFCNDVLHTLIDCNENKSHKIQMFLDYDESIDHLIILSDENKLKQILLNLISNSVKFTTSGYIRLKALANYETNAVIISLEDTGIGIKEEDFHLIFQDHVQSNLEKDYNSKGSGLGLGISKLLADSLNYQINFESTFGSGTTFSLNIPINIIEKPDFIKESLSILKSERIDKEHSSLKFNLIGNEEKHDSPQQKNELSNKILIGLIDNQQTVRKNFDIIKINEIEDLLKEEFTMISHNFTIIGNDYLLNNYCIVVVDDHKFVRLNTINLIKTSLLSLNINDYTIIEGSDGIDLLNIVRKDESGKIKCIFTDENMEFLNGSEAVKIIRKLEEINKIKSNYIVSVTAFDDKATKKNIHDSGVNSILSKPCSKTVISGILKNLFE